MNFNTDGAPLTKSNKAGFCPLQLIINELSPKLRFRNILLAGILLVKREPKPNMMNLFMTKFFAEIRVL